MDEYVCYEGIELKNFDRLDKKFLSFIEDFQYDSYHIPGMISESTLKKCGYIDSFPQQLTIPTHLEKSEIEEVLKEGAIIKKNIQMEKMYMSPSACLHFYPLIEGSHIEQKIMTTLTQVYRYEDGRFNSGSRLWEFNVREIVFIGKEKFVEEMLQMVMERALDYAKCIDPVAYIKVASDLFYPNRKNELKGLMQKKNKLKQELVLHIEGKEVAAASFNYHNNHFSKPFRFDGDGSIVSGCVGFGMERWISACKEKEIILES